MKKSAYEIIRVWYWVREWSESAEFPEVRIYRTEAEARDTMVAEVFEHTANLGGWVTEELDGDHVKLADLSKRIDSLNVQREGGAVDCFRLSSQVIS